MIAGLPDYGCKIAMALIDAKKSEAKAQTCQNACL
jgi:hypothetical protein